MIKEETIEAVLELAAGGMTRRAIARKFGLNHKTVNSIVAKPEHYRARHRDMSRRGGVKGRSHLAVFAARPGRCPRCEKVVLMPCVLCAARRAHANGIPPAPEDKRPPGPGDPTPEEIEALKPPQDPNRMLPARRPPGIREYSEAELGLCG